MKKKEAAGIVRKALQAMHCIDGATYVKVMHNGVDDYYSQGKFKEMQSDPKRWFCELDFIHAERFMQYVLDKEV